MAVNSLCDECDLKLSEGEDLVNQGRLVSRDLAAIWFDATNLLLQRLQTFAHVTNVHSRQRIQASIARMVSCRDRLRVNTAPVVVFGGALNNASTNLTWREIESAFQARIVTGLIVNTAYKNLDSFLNACQSVFVREISSLLRSHNALKINTNLSCLFSKPDIERPEIKSFNTKNVPVFQTTELEDWFMENVKQSLKTQIEEFEDTGSGWALVTIQHLEVNVNRYVPIRGSSYLRLPDPISRRKAVLNIQNNDAKCFAWSVLAAKHPVFVNAHRVQHYERFENELNFGDLTFPIMPHSAGKFEKMNPDLSINIYGLELKNDVFIVVPLYVTKTKKGLHVNLLVIQNMYVDLDDSSAEENDQGDVPPIRYHYTLIRSLSRLISSQISKHLHRIFVCDACLHCFHSENALEIHERDCRQANNGMRVFLPQGRLNKSGFFDNIIEFKDFRSKVMCPFTIYADLESLLVPVQDQRDVNTRPIHKHKAIAIGFYLHCAFDSTRSLYESYRGLDCGIWFANRLIKIADDIKYLYDNKIGLDLSDEEQASFDSATHCHICEKPFQAGSVKARDHCHLGGEYRGAAHASCNLNFKDSRTIAVIFHNLSGYDIHFILRDVASQIEGRLKIIPQNSEKYISMTQYHRPTGIRFRFIDSLKFLSCSLEKLASYLPQWTLIREGFPNISDVQFELLKRKGVFPYEYLTDEMKLLETSLPPQEAFHSRLTGSGITRESYEHGKHVWQMFGIKDLGEYLDLYLKLDVFILAEVFTQFREDCFKTYELDVCHYYTLPGFAMQAMLKRTQVSLELIRDIDQHLFVERAIRGGVCQASNRYAKANNPFCDDYDVTKPTNYILYLDVNNLYGWAMCECLPTGGFQWVEIDSLPRSDLYPEEDEEGEGGKKPFWDVEEDASRGYFLEVDLRYPSTLHDIHNDLPFCPVKQCPPGSKQMKLLTTLSTKERYVLHYRALQQALKHGLKLDTVHRVLKFNQSRFLKPYIDLNTQKRSAATNDFAKNLFKLLNNSVYGKFFERVQNRRDIRLIKKWEGRYGAESLIARPNFHSRTVYDHNLVAIELKKTRVFLNKPTYIGAAILDISKLCLYKFHYETMPIMFKNFSLLYCDTDSLTYNIFHPNVYEVMKQNIQYFDTSDFAENNPFGMPLANKKRLGLLKDELNGRPISEFVALRSKMYALRTGNNKEMRKCKGVKSSVVQKEISFEDYKNCLFGVITDLYCEQTFIRSVHHDVFTFVQRKLALNSFDDKRFLFPNVHDTLAWGHVTIDD